MADTLLTEREALTVRRNLPRFTEDQRAVATTKLESYRQAQEAAGLPLFPSRSQEIVNQRDKTQSIWLDGEEGWKKHSDGKAASWRDATEFREFQRASVLSSMFGDADPVDVASNPKAYRTRLGQQLKRPDLGTDDAAFDAYITKTFQEDRKNQALKYTDENSLYSAIIEAAHDPSNNRRSGGTETFLDWVTANSKNIPAGKLSQWSEEAKAAFRVQRQRRDLALSRANKIINAVENGEPIETAIAPMMGLHPADTALTYNMVQHLAGDERGKDKGVGEKLGESVGRQLLRLASGVTGSIQQQAQLPFKEGQEVFEDLIGNPDEMALERQTELSRPPGASLLGDAAQFAKGRRRVKLTAQQAQAANDAQNRLREGRLVLQQIRDADKGILDPVRKDWWGAHILYGGAETVTSMASYMVPFVGVGAIALAFQSEAEDKLVAAGASRDDARKASVYTAAGQVALDKFQLRLFKKVPGIGGALKKLAQRKNPLSNKTLKSLAKGAAIVGAETGIELLQDPGVSAAVQDIFEGLGADMPDVDWAEIWQEVKDQAPDVALSMIIPAALGAGFFGSYDPSAIPQQGTGRTVMAQATKYGYDADPYGDTNSINGIGHANNQLEEGLSVALSRKTARKLGIKPKQTTDLLVTLPDGTQLSARYDDTIPGRYKEDRIDFYTPSGELAFDGQQVQISVVGEGAESIKDIQGGLDDPAINSAINSAAGVRQVTRDADGWSVELESGESLSVDSNEAALALREDLRQAATEREAQAMVDVQDYLQSTATETESLAFTGELATASDTGAVTLSRDGEVTRILDDPRSMETMRAELDALATGDAGAVGREIVAAVNGLNVVETREGVATLASQVFQGGGIKAQIHETVEARFRALLANGTITEGESLSFVQGIEEATGEKFIKGEATPDAIREAVSEIAVADFVSRRKSDKRLPGNAITAGLEEMIRSAASPAEAKALGKFRAFLRAARAFFKDVFKAAAALKRARAEGKLENEQEFLDQLLGLEPQRQHNEAVVKEADPDYIPPTAEEEADGIAFSISTEQSPTGDGPTVTIAPVRKDNLDAAMALRNKMADGTGVWNKSSKRANVSVGRTQIQTTPETQLIEGGDVSVIGPASFSISAFHGTPHEVDKFSTKNIGTGEGAQAYGWGLYFAESEDVAKGYQKALSANIATIDGEKTPQDWGEITGLSSLSGAALRSTNGNKQVALKKLKERLSKAKRRAELRGTDGSVSVVKQAIAELEAFNQSRLNIKQGSLYTVDLNVEQDELLDWDQPLSEQSELVRKAIGYVERNLDAEVALLKKAKEEGWIDSERWKREEKKMYETIDAAAEFSGKDGAEYYRDFLPRGGGKEASEALAAAGIKGIKYLDGNSRSDGEGSYNYVIFDDADIEITEENGNPATQEAFSVSSEEYLERVAQRVQDQGITFSVSLIPDDATMGGDGAFDVEDDSLNGGTYDVEGTKAWMGPTGLLVPVGEGNTHNLEAYEQLVGESPQDSLYEILKDNDLDWPETGDPSEIDFDEIENEGERENAISLAAMIEHSDDLQAFDIAIDQGWVAVRQKGNKLYAQGDKLSRKQESNLKDLAMFHEWEFIDDTSGALPKAGLGSSFSISSEEYLERVAQRVAGITRAPKERLEAFERSRARLSDLASSLRSEDNVSKALSKNAIRKEKQIRKAADIEERVERIHEANPILEQEDLASLRSNPLIESLALKSKGPVRLNILSRSRAARRPGFGGMHGDYDGSHAIPGHLFGGTDASSAPDIVAQSAFDSGLIASPTPDALWQEIERAMREAATNKESLSVARQEIASAKRIAQKEADAWEAEQLATLPRRQKNTATKDLETGIRSLDALLLGLPAEIRAKVGGFSKMAKLRTNEAREAHLREKVERADRELERYLVEQYREDLTTILDKATPKMKGGERPSGNLGEAGHRFFDQVREVAGLTEAEIEAERAKVATLQQEEENIESAERMADLFEQEQILDAFGGALTHMDAAGLAQALYQAQSVFTENRNKWRMVEEQRLKEVADLRSEIISKLGQPTVRKKLAEIRKRDSKLKRLDDTAMGFISWVQTLEAILGVNHPLVKRWNEAVGDAQAQKTDAMIVMNKRLERVVREAIGGKASQLDAMQWMWDLNNKPAVTVSIKRGSNEDGSRAQTGRRVPVDVALRVIEDSQQATTLGFTPADVGALKQLFETNKNEREFFALPGDYEPGTPELVELTEAEALTVSLLSLQDQYAENLEKWGYDQEVLAAIEESLSKEAKQIRQWMLNEYAEGWEPMNRVFSRMYGVALPQIGNYSPGNFEHIGADREMDAFGEGLMPTGGMRNGSLKTRKTHRAEPRIVSALGVYTSHVAQSEHFQAFAELTRELRGVFGHPAVKGAIKSSAGEEASGKVLKWIEVMESNGLQNPAGKDEATDKAKRLQGRLARIALAGKLGTLMVQSTAAMASSARIGQQAYWAGFARMMTGQGHYREFLNSPMIRRRIEAGASPAQRAAASRVMDRRPTRAAQGELWLMDLIGRVDGGFTAASGAIAYDYHLRQLTEAGMPETTAKAQAMREAEDVVRRTAQPVESTDKSLTELQPDAFARYFLLFASDARKNAAMVLEPLRRAMAPRQSRKRTRAKEILRDKDFWRAAMFTNVLAGGMAYLIRSAWWDMRDDDDYELFDDKHWSAWAALRAMSFAPLEGFPLVRDVVSSFKGGPLDGLDRALGQITTLLEDIFKRDLGSTPIERIERTAVATANASALLSERAVPVAVAANVFDQLFDVIDNTFDDSEEAGKKERARQRAE
jgi:hypothetical protein